MRTTPKSPRGSITLVALCLAIVLGISLASYLALCQQSLRLSNRATQMSKARQLAETGLEEALWSLNTAQWTNASWTTSGFDRSCTLTGYDLGDGALGQVTIKVANFNGPTPPAIATPKITAAGTVTVPGQGLVTRTLEAESKPASLFVNALGVIEGSDNVPAIILPAGTLIDSWDSDPDRDYNVSTSAVPYPATPPNHMAGVNCAAVVAATKITLNGDAALYGYAATFGIPIDTTTSCLIKGPTTPATTKIDPARVSRGAYIPNFPVKAPPTSVTWQTIPSSAARGSTPFEIGTESGPTEYWTTSTDEPGMYYASNGGKDLFLNLNQILRVKGPVVLVIEEDLQISGTAQIEIATTGRLELYVRDDVYINSSNAFINDTHEPKKLGLFCTKEASGDIGFTLIAPQLFEGVIFYDDRNSGSISLESIKINGAILAYNNIKFVGAPPQIHYDTALQYLPKNWFKGVTTPFIVTQVTEIP